MMEEKPKRKRKNDETGQAPPNQRALLIGVLAVLLLAFAGAAAFILVNPAPESQESVVAQSVVTESVTVPFNRAEPTDTKNSYSGIVTLVISGTGQAGNTDWSDAFYLWAHEGYEAIDPPQLQNFDLAIDGQRAIIALGLLDNPPPYSPAHIYTVTYDVGTEARTIAFGISDEVVGDNTGEFRIDISGEQ